MNLTQEPSGLIHNFDFGATQTFLTIFALKMTNVFMKTSDNRKLAIHFFSSFLL